MNNETKDSRVEGKRDFLSVLQENYQAQIAGFYNDGKTDLERAKRNAVIEEYQDLIAIYKAGFLAASTGASGKEDIIRKFLQFISENEYLHVRSTYGEFWYKPGRKDTPTTEQFIKEYLQQPSSAVSNNEK